MPVARSGCGGLRLGHRPGPGRLAGSAAGHHDLVSDPRPEVEFHGFGDNALELRLEVWTRKPHAQQQIKSALNGKSSSSRTWLPSIPTDWRNRCAVPMASTSAIAATDSRFFSNCFVGSEAVDWLARRHGFRREEAVRIGQLLPENGVVHHVLHEHRFRDENFFYRFTDSPAEKADSSLLPGAE